MASDRLVVHASALAALVLPDEPAGKLAKMLEQAEAVAPGLLWAEIRNVLLTAESRGRIGSGIFEQATTIIDALGIVFDVTPSADRVVTLARRYNLTIYDALYLELAQRLSLPLATSDRTLMRAAEAEGIVLV